MIRRLVALATAALVLSAPAVTTAPSAAAATTKAPKGSVKVRVLKVTDGDTIRVRVSGRSTPVRLIGLNAPEMSPRQCYGPQATTRMKRLTAGGYVYIKRDSTQGNKDKYGRLLRHVYTTKGSSVALNLINGGYAREYTYSRAYAGRTSYLRAQTRAKKAKRGLWKACAAKPKPKTTAKPKPKTTSSCKIKGNISSTREKIYHVPGQRFYTVTKIDTSKGERWFCTEKQARNAGWRKSKV